jgi:hypothetical protein
MVGSSNYGVWQHGMAADNGSDWQCRSVWQWQGYQYVVIYANCYDFGRRT